MRFVVFMYCLLLSSNVLAQQSADELVGLIKQDIKALKLTTPENDSANGKLNQLAALDRKHPYIKEGRQTIRDIYGAWIEKQLAAGNADKAETYLQSLSKVKNSKKSVRNYKRKITALRKETKQQTNQPAASKKKQTPSKTASAKVDYGADCKKASFFKRLSVKAAATRKTKSNRRGDKQVPYGSMREIDISKGEFKLYYTMPNLAIRKYNFISRMYDANGKRILNLNHGVIDNKEILNQTWTAWLDYRPSGNEALGTWTYVVCEGGYRHSVKEFKAVRN